jgi:hypothetical protein
VILSANPAVRRREEELLARARLQRIDAQLDHLLRTTVGREGGATAPTSTPPPLNDADVQDLAERLAEDRSWLPHGAHVETTCVDTSTPLQKPYGAVYTNLATSITIPIVGTFTPRGLLETGLVTKGGKFQAHVYERMLSEVDGVVKGKLIGPRDVVFARQEAARAKYPQLWHA